MNRIRVGRSWWNWNITLAEKVNPNPVEPRQKSFFLKGGMWSGGKYLLGLTSSNSSNDHVHPDENR